MKTKSGHVLSQEEWEQSLKRLMYKPPRMPVELYCKFEQVPQAELDEDEIKVRPARVPFTCSQTRFLSATQRVFAV
jgi:hypothetical protein